MAFLKRFPKIVTLVGTRCKSTKNDNNIPVPSAKEVNSKNAVFDQITHTGQAWDQADVRLARFEIAKKEVNPNVAAHLIAEIPPKACDEHVVYCDGGHPALGHPKIFINLDKPGTHACGYCGLRFYNSRSTKPEDLGNAHIQV
uniref:Zinc finger CHCC-type domain-containing protein n=1 Tax=Ditylenchus dipsaci TaxID=166011 RepID=A0A915DUL1_9BILA